VSGATTTAPDRTPAPPDGAGEVTDHLVRLARLIQVARSRLGLSAGQERDRAAHLVLQAIDRLGAVRQRSLAEALRADPSTLSRQVTFLAQRGLIRRCADDRDGRACLLELTDVGADKVAELRRRRESAVGDLLAGWTPADRSDFTRLLGRFVDDLADHLDGSRPDAGSRRQG
jgi:DNA-binding MarR family transcriptional regulator